MRLKLKLKVGPCAAVADAKGYWKYNCRRYRMTLKKPGIETRVIYFMNTKFCFCF
jgi:hypothetical protein